MNKKLLDILRSPDDGTSLNEDLVSEQGNSYSINEHGVILMKGKTARPLDVVYEHSMFSEWDKMMTERLEYYTEKKTIAGKLADLTYKSMNKLNIARPDEWVLDIGCGDGSQLKYLKNKENYIGMDINLERLRILKERYPEATVIYADAAKLPFKAGAFRFIYSSNAFEHLWYLKEVVLECYRCTYKNGEMVILFPTEGGLWNLGRNILSKPFFQKKNPDLDFELISHIEHCNNATQIMRTLETFFNIKKKYLPFRFPSIYTNALVKVECSHFSNDSKHFKIKFLD